MKNRNYFTLFFSLTLLSAFVICSAIVLFFQINSYHTQQQINASNEEERLAQSYLTTLFHQRTTPVEMELKVIDDVPCIVIKNDQNSTVTYIYTYEGYLRELYLDENTTVTLALGDKITPMGQMKMEENNGLYTFQMIYQDHTKDLYLYRY